MGLHRRYSPELSDFSTLVSIDDVSALAAMAASIRDEGFGDTITYSRKVFIPLTKLCRDVCHYCTFAHPPRKGERAFLTPDEVLEIAREGARVGCTEALFTLGDKPELRYRVARGELQSLGHDTTLSYLEEVASLVFRETGILPHLNPGLSDIQDYRRLREVSVSQGIMLESASERLCQKGMPHFGSKDKIPAVRLKAIHDAGKAGVPLTTGLLIGIGETREERIDALLKLRELHEQFGHIQEIIIQNFCAKPGTKMAEAPEPALEEQIWTIAVTRLLFGAEMSIQSPPNLRRGHLPKLIAAGINDWGGVSPVTPDHVNPEAPWPEIMSLAKETEKSGKYLAARLPVYPKYITQGERWMSKDILTSVLRKSDSLGFARDDTWHAGLGEEPPFSVGQEKQTARTFFIGSELSRILDKAVAEKALLDNEIVQLFSAHSDAFRAICSVADGLRKDKNGDEATYVVNRNINYTNICYFRCQFCAFSKGKTSEDLRGSPYLLGLEEIAGRTREAWELGATEVCLQGGIHPKYTGNTYLEICRAIKQAVPDIHIHAFSPLEIWQGANTLGISVSELLTELRSNGLASLPGTAAEILDEEVRAIICPDKINTSEWLEVMKTAHNVGLKSTATIMFGHVEQPIHWARHLNAIRNLQSETGGFTEFVPLPFVHLETPIYLKGKCRQGPTYREAVLMHAVSRLALNPIIPNIQTSWVKMGAEGTLDCLRAGANDLGGTLMNETISRSAGAKHGQEMKPETLTTMINRIGRIPRQRTTLYRKFC